VRGDVSTHPPLSRNPPPACLCKENPNRLVTLWDIVREFNLPGLLTALSMIELLEHPAERIIKKQHGGVPMPDIQIKAARTFLRHSLDVFVETTFADSKEIVERFLESINDEGFKERGLQYINMDASTFATNLQHLKTAIDKDIKRHRYIQVMPDRFNYLSPVTVFGAKVHIAFRDAHDDMAEAGNCLAIELHTAAVFHLIRVAEYGLRALAVRVGAKLRDKGKRQPLEFAEWGKVITAINNRIAAARNKLSKGPKLDAQLQFYSEAADHCLYLKELRNEVSHTRKSYNGPEALGVMERVRAFMEVLERGFQKQA
jgi:hypothetical protein